MRGITGYQVAAGPVAPANLPNTVIVRTES